MTISTEGATWTGRGVLAWLVCAAFFCYEFMLRTILGAFEPAITQELSLNAGQFALISSTAYIIVYGMMQIPVGVFIGRFGLRLALLIACGLCVVSMIGFALSHTMTAMLFFRVMTGMGSSFGFIGLLVAVFHYLPATRSAFFVGVSLFIGTLGPMLASGPVEVLCGSVGVSWRELLWLLALVGGVLALLAWLFIPQKNQKNSDHVLIIGAETSLAHSLKKLLRQTQIWYIAIYSGCIYFFLEYFAENQGHHLLELKGFTSQEAANFISVAWLGYAIGGPCLGYLADVMTGQRLVMGIAASLVALAISALLYLPLTHFGAWFVCVLLGFGVGGQGVSFALISEYCDEETLAVGFAFNNGFISLVSAFVAPVLGFWLARGTGSSATPMIDYQLVFVLPLLMAVTASLVATFLLKEKQHQLAPSH